MKSEDLKEIVKKRYSEIAEQSKERNQSSCCGSTCDCKVSSFTVFSEEYSTLEGYDHDADLGLGCGIPTQFAGINKGDAVLDLGSGAGNDCFVALAIVGDAGKVTGLDFTEAMLVKANENNQKLGYNNVEFVRGDIEEMPLPAASYDVVVSNCVLNLVPDKDKAFSEILRVLKPGGHFCVSDVVLKGHLPAKLRDDAVMYAGCVSGALQMEDYLGKIDKTGFEKVTLHKQKKVEIPDEILEKYLDRDE
ncbi:MAG: arsenite methyltransferase, partial [Bacteroidota bacterium]|nr:arsenite methyltransferase [Bacteroidota bacterium]